MAKRWASVLFGWGLLLSAPARANSLADGLQDLSLEQLGDIEVRSVSKRAELLADAPASIYVIGRAAIRHAGAATLPQALRLAPNLQVARINASQYAISARGFNSSTANKLLVLIDGRAIYTPLYSGVFWDAQDLVMDDVDRIEVISGPGGVLWGTNAVNGVINVITRRAAADDGTLLNVRLGGETRVANARVNLGLAGSGSPALRLYAKHVERADSRNAAGARLPDGWTRTQAGFRYDRQLAAGAWNLQGDAYQVRIDQLDPRRQQHRGANLLTHWRREFDDEAALSLQAYWDRVERNAPGSYSETLDSAELDLQYNLPRRHGRQWIVGAGHRQAHDRVGHEAGFAFLPERRRMAWTQVYAQFDNQLSDTLRVQAGMRAERNDWTGIETMPSLKLAWKTAEDQLIWSGLARAVRTPSRIDTDFYAPARPPYLLAGGPAFRSELIDSLDLGWRGQFGAWRASATAFAGRFHRLRSFVMQPDRSFVFVNEGRGHQQGLEAWGSWQASPALTVQAGLMLLRQRFATTAVPSVQGYDPRYQAQLGLDWEIGDLAFLHLQARRVDRLRNTLVPAYTAIDLRWSWELSPQLQLALSGRNLNRARHLEFYTGTAANLAKAAEVSRSLALSATLRF